MTGQIVTHTYQSLTDWEIKQLEELLYGCGELCKIEARGISLGIIKKLVLDTKRYRKFKAWLREGAPGLCNTIGVDFDAAVDALPEQGA